jgi:hypothetical protein
MTRIKLLTLSPDINRSSESNNAVFDMEVRKQKEFLYKRKTILILIIRKQALICAPNSLLSSLARSVTF